MKVLSYICINIYFLCIIATFKSTYAAPVASNFSTPEVCLGQVTNSTLAGNVTGGVAPYTYSIVTNPTQGTITSFSATSGAFTYTQFNNFANFSDTFTYKAIDSTSASSNTATVTVLVAFELGGVEAALCTNSSVSLTLNGKNIGGTAPFTYTITSFPSVGTLILNPNFTANGDFTYNSGSSAGTPSLRFSLTDALGCTPNLTASNNVVEFVVGQTAPNITISGKCIGSTVSSTLFGNVVGATNYTIVTNPSKGTLTPAFNFSGSGNFTYTSNATFTGNTDSFTYQLTNAIGCVSTVATVTIDVGVVASNLTTRITCPGGSLTASVLSQASVGLAPYQYHIVTNPSQGTLTLDPNFLNNGDFTYTAFNTFNGSQDTFTFYVTDSNGCVSNTATVTIPVGLKLNNVTTSSVCVGNSISGTLAGVGNLPDTFNLVTPPSYGALIFNTSDGNYTYSPSVLYTSSSDSFSYSVTDTTGCVSNTATITIPITLNTIGNIITPSVCSAGILNTNLSETVSSTNLSYTFNLIQGPSDGCLTLDPNFALNGQFTYIPMSGFTGSSDSFTYQVLYANGCESNIATATIPIGLTVENYSTQVVCQGSSFSSILNPPSFGGIPPLTYMITSGPSHGTISYTASNGIYTYSTTGFTGPFDSFTYTITDSINCTSNPVTVTIPVGIQIANATIPATCPGVSIAGNLSAFLSRGEAPFTYTLLTPPTHGALNLTGSTGAYTYVPTPGYTGLTDNFIFNATDANGCASNNAAITIDL